MSKIYKKGNRVFTRQHYQGIAKVILGMVIATSFDDAALPDIMRVAEAFIAAFVAEYPEFDRSRFLVLCGLE